MSWSEARILRYRKGEPPPPVRAPAGSKRVRVGIWDINASAGSLPLLLEAIEKRQTYFSFYTVQAAFQSVLAAPGPHVAKEWTDRAREEKKRTGISYYPMSAADAQRNVSAVALYGAAKPIVRALPVEWLVIIVDAMISETRGKGFFCHNLFATHSQNVILVSTYDVRRYAALGERPFEVAVMGIVLSAVIAALVPEVTYHRESTGSIFDYCENRDDLVGCIKNPHIDEANSALLSAPLLSASLSILRRLKDYKGSGSKQLKRQKRAYTKLSKKATKRPLQRNSVAESSHSASELFTMLLEDVSSKWPTLKQSASTQLSERLDILRKVALNLPSISDIAAGLLPSLGASTSRSRRKRPARKR